MAAETSKVTRLPTQHRTRPHCPSCGREAPKFSGFVLDTLSDDLGEWTMTGVTLHLVCPCGAEWDLKKTVKE